jgi:hypothetical protein
LIENINAEDENGKGVVLSKSLLVKEGGGNDQGQSEY